MPGAGESLPNNLSALQWFCCGLLQWYFQEKWRKRQTIEQILCCIPKLLYLKGKMLTGADK